MIAERLSCNPRTKLKIFIRIQKYIVGKKKIFTVPGIQSKLTRQTHKEKRYALSRKEHTAGDDYRK